MKRLLSLLAAGSAFALASPSIAQHSSMPGMPGMEAPAEPSSPAPAEDHSAHAPDHAAMGHDAAMLGMDHSGPDMAAMPDMQATGTALPAGNAPPPPVPSDHYADRFFPAAEMERARDIMMMEEGASQFGQVLLNVFEYQAHRRDDGYRWSGEAWYGGDINRLWLKSEGEGAFGGNLETAELQALYSRAIDPYFNLQAGIRQDFGRGPGRTYATIGIEGLAPGFSEVDGAMFLSSKGDVLGRFEAYYDQRITQRLIFQPRLEINLSAQDIPESAIGAGLTDIELGGRLRYEFSRQFAPYVGISYLHKSGATARLARTAGEDADAVSFVAGLRFWL